MIAAEFHIPGMTAQQYDQTVADLEAKGLGAPAGRLHHIAAATDDGWYVVDVWSSMEEFEAFGETLIPVLIGAGVTPVEPVICQLHNVIRGA